MPRRAARLFSLIACAAAAATVAAAPAQARDRWTLADVRPVPIEYFQGLTHLGDAWFFDGPFEGLYRTDRELREQARNPNAIPPDVKASQGFNHIGDPTADGAEGGRLLLPLECYTPGGANGGNTCGRGAIGVADPQTLAWRYAVALDPADIPKAMWAEVSPDGELLWTSSGNDLLAYRTADISAATAAASTAIRPVRRLAGAVPPSGITGAVFHGGRLFLAGQSTGPLEIRSLDLTGATPTRLEARLRISAESEGLDVFVTSGGVLHWLLSPIVPGGGEPTYGAGHSTLLSFVPRANDRLRATASPKVVRAGRRATVTVRVTLRYAGRARPVSGARVRLAGRSARTNASGIARVRIRPRRAARLTAIATKQRLRPGRAHVSAIVPPGS